MRAVKFIFSRLFFCILVIAVISAAIIFLCLYLHSLLPAALGAAAAYALSITSALILLLRDGRVDYKCAWLAVIAALPFIGAILYALSCTGSAPRQDNPIPPPLSHYDEFEYFKDGARYLSRLRERISEAKERVYLEYYIIAEGCIWGLICKELESALARGVDVAIIYDGLGSGSVAPVKDFGRLSAMGAHIRVFNKPKPFPVSRLNCRNHRKIAAIDGKTVFLGGVNIADEYANITSPHGYWKDGGIMLCGQVAKDYSDIFTDDFHIPARTKKGRAQGDNAGGRKGAQKRGTNKLRIVADAPTLVNGCCEELVAAKIYSAQKTVCIFTPYLCVGEKLKDALIYAAGRGAKVRVIIPEIPDKKITFEISLTYAAELCRHGIEIYRYKPGFMHAKCVICDGETLLGSYNFDFRSMRLNYECGIWAGGEITERVKSDFEETLAISTRIEERKVPLVRRIVRGGLKVFAPLF